MSHKKIIELCKQHHIIPIAKGFIFKDKQGGWDVDLIDSCMWTERGFAFDGGDRHCSSLAFVQNEFYRGMTKSQVWDSVAEDIKFEGRGVYECDCERCQEEV